MIRTKDDTYSGSIDWNMIYREYYQLDSIECRLREYLSSPCPIAFCGFGEIASRLSTTHSVHFIEYSESVVEAAELEFQNIEKISHLNILDAIKSERSRVIFVVCRVSAYWTSPNSLSRFVLGLRQLPRDLVVVDFFDVGKLESNETLGNPDYSELKQIPIRENLNTLPAPPIHLNLARVNGTYQLQEEKYPFSETRAYYNPCEVRDFVSNHLYEYDISIEPPIVDLDPGFTLVIRRSD